ncbi:MAG: D-alanyl-D-alanine carboxypeptidase [Clostridia bacterium]|nr:D-alanyl-D-alanine carboxypeptidase [Clostridia bacterium]
MKYNRLLALLLALLMLFGALTVSAEETSKTEVKDNPAIFSGNAVMAYCIDDDQFLYADKADTRVAPTVATKLVACMVVSDILKERNLESDKVTVTVTQTAIDNSGDIADVRVPMMGIKAGNTYNVKDLLSATLVACANDAVAALACHFGETYLGGGINEFVDKMNAKVGSLGLESTHFENPTGLDSPNQYTTPRDVAYIASAFYKYDELVKLSDVESFLFNGSTTVRNKNYLKSNYYVSGFLNRDAIGLIAGQLNKSGNYCLISASQKEGRTYVFVVMCASGMIVTRDEQDRVTYSFGAGNAYEDMNKLIKWTRESFKLLTVATKDTVVGELRINAGDSAHVMVVPSEDVEKLVLDIEGVKIETKLVYDESRVYKKEFNGGEYDTIDAPVQAGQRVGTIVYSYNGLELASVDAVAREAVDSDGLKSVLEGIKGFLFGSTMKTLLYIIGALIGAWLLFSLVMVIVRAFTRNKENKGERDGRTAKKAKKKAAKKPKPTKKQDKNTETKEL